MSQSVQKFIRQILNKHARDGIEAIAEKSNQVHSDVVAVTIVLPDFGPDEHPLYEYGLAFTSNKGSIQGVYSAVRDMISLHQYHDLLQRFIDTLKNEQSVVEMTIEKFDTPQ